jgi:ubiquinone/menaquinone biosynthesis C-methylase UbiE
MTVSFDRVAKIYDTTRWTGVPAHVMEKILNAMKGALKGCELLLDVGTGTGRFAQFFDSSGFTVVGVDVSLSMMVQAREKGVRNLVRADAHHLPFRDGSFDGSIMIHVLHLVENWVQVIHEVGRATRKIVISEAGEVEGFDPRERYLELRTEMGYPLNRFNDSELGLRRVVPPMLVVRAADYWTDVNTDEEIASFDARKSSVMWDIPIEVHRRIMRQLRTETGGRTLRRHDTPEVVGWDPAKLRAYEP